MLIAHRDKTSSVFADSIRMPFSAHRADGRANPNLPLALMKTPSYLRLFSALVITGWCLSSPAVRAQGTPSGSVAASTFAVTGTVTNAGTNRVLEGARVILVGTDREAFTDRQGVYRLPLPSDGDVMLEVSYTGLDTVTIPVRAKAEGGPRQDVKLTSAIYRLGQFVVAGEREGNAQAITLQRQSSGVKSIVSADAFGNLAGNPADLLVRLPGVEGQSMDGDIRYIRIRGMSQNLNTITINGNRAANAGSAGSTREYQFEHTNADAIERMEVVKSPTPDMDADSIGGAVNMVTKSAFDSSPLDVASVGSARLQLPETPQLLPKLFRGLQ